MCDNVQIALTPRPLGPRLDWFCAEVGLGMMPYGLRRARMRQVLQLEAHSDHELAIMGLNRDDILRHVFRDLTG